MPYPPKKVRILNRFFFCKAQLERNKINNTTIEIDQNDAKMHLSLFFYTGLSGVANLDIAEE